MSSKNERAGYMSSNDFGAADFFAKMSSGIFRTCPGHVLFQKMSPKFCQRTEDGTGHCQHPVMFFILFLPRFYRY